MFNKWKILFIKKMGAKFYTSMPLNSPKYPIVALDNRFVFQEPKTLSFYYKPDREFSIKDNQGTPYFKCIEIKPKILFDLFDLYGNNLFQLKHDFSTDNYLIMKNGNVIISINHVGFVNAKYVINLFNLQTKQMDYIEMKHNVSVGECFVFHGKQKLGGEIICKIKKSLMMKSFIIEIAPNVDISLMTALAICFKNKFPY